MSVTNYVTNTTTLLVSSIDRSIDQSIDQINQTLLVYMQHVNNNIILILVSEKSSGPTLIT